MQKRLCFLTVKFFFLVVYTVETYIVVSWTYDFTPSRDRATLRAALELARLVLVRDDHYSGHEVELYTKLSTILNASI